ncbi:hypothetical protein K1T71_002983 [Dendrolimus kikuchii]|uniref:Uncharacterized protein n=1 Tax=Dendrolimus kikuchii TaxID=765133 RepID=A0ACC1DBC0_9NEOP|nr:hypothetical protein K1T71_002983 [Dendrolimus kikuchii]
MSNKTKSHQVLVGQTREMVVRLVEYFRKERDNGSPLLPLACVVERVAEALQIGKSTVTRILREKRNLSGSEQLKTPGLVRPRGCPVTDVDYDVIRNHIQEYYYARNITLTHQALRDSLYEQGLFKGDVTSLRRVLKRMANNKQNKEDSKTIKGVKRKDSKNETLKNQSACNVDKKRPEDDVSNKWINVKVEMEIGGKEEDSSNIIVHTIKPEPIDIEYSQ